MVKFGQYLKHNIVPEWRDKFIDYKGLKKIIKKFNQESTPRNDNSVEDSANDIEMAPIRVSDIYSKEMEEKNFRQIDNSEIEGMIHLDGKQMSTIDGQTYFTFTAVPSDKINDALLIRAQRSFSEWESNDGSISYNWLVPSISSSIERQFFEKLKIEIEMVNKWYVEKLNECKSECEKYSEQISQYLLFSKEQSLSRKSRQLEFGLKELYRFLEYLHNYCTLNRTAIDKILKKHDKQSEFQSRGTVTMAIKELSFYKEKEVTQLRGYVEALWRKFKGKDSSNVMKDLKSLNQHFSLKQSFQIGCFVGASLTLLMVLLILFSQYNILFLNESQKSVLFLSLRFQFFLILQMWCWSFDLYVFHYNRINFEYIFGQYFPRLLHYQQQGLKASVITFVSLLIVVAWYYLAFVKCLLPEKAVFCILPLLQIIVVLFVFPFPGYAKAKWYMLSHCVSIFGIPFYHVQFPDFFLGDQLTSHGQTLHDGIHLLLVFCLGSFLTFDESSVYLKGKTAIMLISTFVPSLIRFVQCLRRYYDTHDSYPHLYNGVKYLLSLIAQCCFWNTKLYAIVQFIYTLYALNWDLREDWGLLHNVDQGKWFLLRRGDPVSTSADSCSAINQLSSVRSKHLLSETSYYYVAICVNSIMRFLWILKLGVSKKMDENVSALLFGSLEIIRRCIWNIFRMENEQVNNCGKFRATVEVPLPFPEL